MTIKNESKNKNNKTSTPKEILYEAVQKNPTRNYIIMGALTQAGLYIFLNYGFLWIYSQEWDCWII